MFTIWPSILLMAIAVWQAGAPAKQRRRNMRRHDNSSPPGPGSAFRRTPALLLLLAYCVSGCGDSTSPTGCQAGAVLTHVSDGLTPTITWAAECGAQVVAVYDASTGLPVWQLRADTRDIPKPVLYGVVPGGVMELNPAEDLHAGTKYGVYVALLVGADTLAEVGNFTP
jgi:hypothetical protein